VCFQRGKVAIQVGSWQIRLSDDSDVSTTIFMTKTSAAKTKTILMWSQGTSRPRTIDRYLHWMVIIRLCVCVSCGVLH